MLNVVVGEQGVHGGDGDCSPEELLATGALGC